MIILQFAQNSPIPTEYLTCSTSVINEIFFLRKPLYCDWKKIFDVFILNNIQALAINIQYPRRENCLQGPSLVMSSGQKILNNKKDVQTFNYRPNIFIGI